MKVTDSNQVSALKALSSVYILQLHINHYVWQQISVKSLLWKLHTVIFYVSTTLKGKSFMFTGRSLKEVFKSLKINNIECVP